MGDAGCISERAAEVAEAGRTGWVDMKQDVVLSPVFLNVWAREAARWRTAPTKAMFSCQIGSDSVQAQIRRPERRFFSVGLV